MKHHKYLVRVGNLNPIECGRCFYVYAIDNIEAYQKAEKEVTSDEFIQGVYLREEV